MMPAQIRLTTTSRQALVRPPANPDAKRRSQERCISVPAQLASASRRAPPQDSSPSKGRVRLFFFRLSSFELALILSAIIFGATILGLVLGRAVRHRSEHIREPLGVLQSALLGLVGLVLA